MSALLEVDELAVRFDGEVDALRGVSFALERGESLAVVGESGAGKSTLALCLAGLIQPPAARGSVRLGGQELLGASEDTLRSLRWETVALALQGSPFNPVVTLGNQVAEPLRERRGTSSREARKRADELAGEVLLDPAVLERHPHELSGGERRRATLAMALALDPDLLVLDEPTGGLDPVTGSELVERIGELAAARDFGLIVISHELAGAAALAQRSVVLYAGEAMEAGDTTRVIGDPAHPYTWALVNAYPVMSTTKDLRPIRGLPPDPRAVPPGCPFHPRCPQAEDVCHEQRVSLEPSRARLVACHFGGLKTLLDARGVGKTFGRGRRRGRLKALEAVSFALRQGEAVGVVGPSGSGKSTLARILTGHLATDTGEVTLQGRPLVRSWGRSARAERVRIQLVMQDPWDALSPRLTVEELVREPLDLGAGDGDGDGDGTDDRAATVAAALESVGLPASGQFLGARSHELSGGQLQRVALARAVIVEPELLVADEPTSMLDASEQARLMVALRERQTELGLGLVLISHDIALVRKATDRIVVLDAGRVVEEGRSERVSSAPRSLTARRLIEAAPELRHTDESGDREPIATGGET
ncbi:MAG: ABC transporter ATP-binding protein [Solirubrobacteraceae bacterium MAG38_C4-C5]|nr:ABC transporter ATP-binding protein [Candidatus Siliceabacter maunaloa]